MIRSLYKLGASLEARQAARAPSATTIRTPRPFHSTAASRMAYKDTQDRESLKPSGTEGTKTGRDSDVASNNPDAAFNPNKTSPESAKESSGSELDVSGANQEVSKPQGDEKAPSQKDAGKETHKGGASGKGSPTKGGKPQ